MAENTKITFPVYRIYQLDENETLKRIIVFYGDNLEPILSLSEIFSDIEIVEIEDQKTEVIFSKLQIHPDDTIETVKMKIAMELQTVSYFEIYIYSRIRSSLYLEKFYNDVTQKEQSPFTPNMLGQLLMNLQWNKESITQIPDKDNYTYEDLLKIVGETQEREILVPLGMKFSSTRNLLFSTDPYELLPSDTVVFNQTVENPLLAFMNTTLLSYGDILENKIYVYFLDNVLEYAVRNEIDEKYVVQLYFPELKDENISSADELLQKKQDLLQRTRKRITPELVKQHKTVNMFYDIQLLRPSATQLKYVSRGIQTFEIVFHPESKIVLPLEAIFKNVHATAKTPFIKYNPGNRRENVYRLYYDKVSKSGKKIPVLKKTQIVYLSKQSGKPRQVSFFVAAAGGIELFIDVNQNGDVVLRGDFNDTPKTPKEMTAIFEEWVDPIINSINAFLQQTGYKLYVSSSFLKNETVEIVRMKYKSKIETPVSFDLKSYMSGLTSIFEVLETNVTKGALLRFKRVDNYRKMDAIQSMITEVLKRTNDEVAVVNSLMSNYSLNHDEALMQIAKYFNDHIRIQGKYVNKSLDVADNPGFPTSMKLNMENLFIEIDNITSIDYIEILECYIDSFVLFTQHPDDLGISVEKIKGLFSGQIKETSKIADKPETVIIPATVERIQPLQFAKKYDDEEEDEDDDDEFEGKIFFDDEDEDETEVSKQEEEQTGGVTSENETYSRYFLQKKKKLEPNLFLTAKEGQYKAYTRACPLQRQPVILTEEEKQKIDKENRDAYTYAVKYGTNPDKKYWYVCPRFWCMKTNQPISEDRVKLGECAGSVREFTSSDHVKDGKYINHYPGFLPKDTHPTSCVPCCMRKNWDTNVQQKIRRQECDIDDENDITRPEAAAATEAEDAAEPVSQKKLKPAVLKKTDTSNLYIVGFDKYPIPKERWGFLPPAIQMFLQINYNDVIVRKTPSLIKPGSTTFLRYGVEQSRNQSFIGCFADIYASLNHYKDDNKPIPTIKEFRTTLQKSITLDLFLKAHNGSLVSIFQPAKIQLSTEIIHKHVNTEFYRRIDQTDEAQVDFLEDTVAAFENFLQYIGDDDALIDHTYMWDIITSNNPTLFPNGLNLVVLEIADNDITDNVEILCPTNSYMDKYYDPSRETVILLKHNEYYEPIYMYNITTATEKTLITTAAFSSETSPPELKRILSIIQKSNNKYCRGFPSMPRVYQFKQNILAVKLHNILKTYQYHIVSQVSNYRGKIIGLITSVSKDTPSYFVPCFPSSQVTDTSTVIPVIFMDDVKWQPYDKTRDFLLSVAKMTKGEVLSNPAFKVVEQNLIIGMLTETNQYIQIDPPIANNVEDDIPVYNSVGYGEYFDVDKTLATKTTPDPERTQVTKRVYLETQFYTAFRTTVRIILNEFHNRKVRDKIIQWIEDDKQFYQVKLKKIDILLRTIMSPHIVFNDIPPELLAEFGEISTCMSDCKEKKYCLVKQGGECVLILPNRNLITGEENQTSYYSRISDELLRYKRIQMFLLKPKKYLNITDTEYKINDREFILIQSLLDGNYFDNLEPYQLNQYVTNIPYDTATPIISQKYSSNVSLKDQTDNIVLKETNKDGDYMTECVEEVLPAIVGNDRSYWPKIFPLNSQEIVFNTTVNCTFYLLIEIIRKRTKIITSISDLKSVLIKKYRELPQHANKILSILAKQGGKKKLVEKVVSNRITLEDMIMSEEYFLTNLDLWAISSILNLPILLFSSKNLENLLLNVKWITLGGNREKSAFFAVRSSIEKGTVPQYHLINPSHRLNKLNNNFYGMINNPEYAENNLSFETYLDTHNIAV